MKNDLQIRKTKPRIGEIEFIDKILQEKKEYLKNPKLMHIVSSSDTSEFPISLKVTKKQQYELAERCKATNETRAYHIKQAIEQYLWPKPPSPGAVFWRILEMINKELSDRYGQGLEVIDIPPISIGNYHIEIKFTKKED